MGSGGRIRHLCSCFLLFLFLFLYGHKGLVVLSSFRLAFTYGRQGGVRGPSL